MIRRNEVPNPDVDSNFRYIFNGQLDSGGILSITSSAIASAGLHHHTVVDSTTSGGVRFTLPECSDALGKTMTFVAKSSGATNRITLQSGNTFFTTSGGSPVILDLAAGSKVIDFKAISTSQWAVTGLVVLSQAYVTTHLTFADAS